MRLTAIGAVCLKGNSAFSFYIITELWPGPCYSFILYVNSLLHLEFHLLLGAIVGVVTKFRHAHIRQLRGETRYPSW